MAVLSPVAKQQFFTDAGALAAGYLLYTYAANTTTPQATYSNKAGTSANANPIVLDSQGRATIYLSPTLTYDYVLKTAAGVTVWTQEDVSAAPGDGDAVTFTQSGTGAVARTMQGKGQDFPTLLDFIDPDEHAAIKAGTSTYDATDDVVAAFAAHDAVKATAGLYNVSTFTLAAGKRLLTDGHATIFQQIAGQAVGTRMIVVGGSNVEIGTMTVRGNIATDTDEQNHAIFIQANATTGDIDNVRIGDIHGQDIRGDVIYYGQATGAAYLLTNVHIGNVTFDNVYRNGVSCVSCDGFSVESVTGSRIGFCHMDIEANAGSGPCVNGTVGRVKGRIFGLVSQAVADYIDNVEIGVLDLSPTHAAQSSPSYAPGEAIGDALLLRNVKRARVGKLKVAGYDRCAMFVTYSSGELGCEDLEVGSADLSDCSNTDTTYNSYVHWPTLTTNRLRIGHLKIDVDGTGKMGMDGLRNGTIGSIEATVATGCSAVRDCRDVQIGSIVATGGIMLNACQRISVGGGSHDGERLASSSTACSFENFTATESVLVFTSGQENHDTRNCTLNTDYYGFGTGIRAHTYALRFGGYHCWVDANGRLRRKNGAPTSDTDGAIAWAATKGATASRPTLGASDIGFMYLDTTLAAAGKPIWWTGTAWVDSSGTAA